VAGASGAGPEPGSVAGEADLVEPEASDGGRRR
jgi:hypothetical protein